MSTEMEKLDAAGDTYGDLVEFLDWLGAHEDLSLGEWRKWETRVEPVLVPAFSRSSLSIIYEYLGIDANRLEAERRALLDGLHAP